MRRDDEFWVALQSILTIAGNASKLLWGSWGNEATAARRQPLRELVGASDNSPLRSRDVRNAFEHFDDEVETWHRAGDIDVYASRQIGTDAVYPPANSRFGYYNPRTRVVTFLKWSASIPDLLAELERIRVALQS